MANDFKLYRLPACAVLSALAVTLTLSSASAQGPAPATGPAPNGQPVVLPMPQPPNDAAVARLLEQLQTDITVLQFQVEKQKLVKTLAEGAILTAPPASAAAQPGNQQQADPDKKENQEKAAEENRKADFAVPFITRIDGPHATLSYGGSSSLTVGAGDDLPGGGRVVSVTPESVRLRADGKSILLRIGRSPVTTP